MRWPGATIEIPAVWNPDRALPPLDPEDENEAPRFGAWESPCGRYWFDGDAADRAAQFFPDMLTHYKGEFAGQPFHLLPYQEYLVIRPLFGWKKTSDNLRRFRKVFVAVPKGNGKSPLGAGVGIYLTFCDSEDGAEVFSAAADRENAGVVFDNAKIMVESCPELERMADVQKRLIWVAATRSSYKVCSADAATKHGPGVHGLIFDEFHAQRSRDLYETMDRGTSKRRQPVTLLMTTAGDDDESICAEEWDYAAGLMLGTIKDETFLPVIFEAKATDDWKDPKVWARVNPGLGVTKKTDAVAIACQAAINEPRKLNDFLRFDLNRWVNQATAWIPIDWWDEKCRQPLLTDAELNKLELGAGLDLSEKYDLSALVLVFKLPFAGKAEAIELVSKDEERQVVTRKLALNFELVLMPFFWLPKDTMREREREDTLPYQEWADKGLLHPTEGDIIDYNVIFDDITGPISRRFPKLRESEIGFDPAFANMLAGSLLDQGYRMVETPQGYKHLSEPAQTVEALIRGGRVRHGGNPVLRQHVANVAIRRDESGRIRPVKPRRKKRIDGVVATLMGTSRLIANAAGAGGGWRPL